MTGVSAFIPDIASLIEYLSTQLDKLGVKVMLATDATPRLLREQAPDAVILATGRIPMKPKIKGADRQEVMTIDELMQGKPVGNNVIIVGGGYVGCEIAFFLALAGKLPGLRKFEGILSGSLVKQVHRWLLTQPKTPSFLRKYITVIEESDTIAYDVELKSKQVIREVFTRYGVQEKPGLKLAEIIDGGIIAIDKRGMEHLIKADSVIITGSKANNGLLEELKKADIPVYPVGDCVEPRKIYDAIHEGFLAAYRL